MSTNTSRYNLVKPALTDTADITAMNGNWDTIDGMLGIAQTYSPIEITSGQDLNNLRGASIYKCTTNVTASSLANSPTTNAFSMVVLQSSGNSMTQIITEYMPTGAKQFRRNYYSGWDTPWGAWKEIPTKDDLAAISTKQDTITGAATTITSSNLTASRALVSNSSGKVAVSSVTSTELGYLSGVSSAIQTQMNAKQATITGGATTITTSNLTANRALVANASGKVAVSAVTSTELGYMSGVTSNVQTQLNAKRNTSSVVDVAHGGTGKTTAVDATNTLLSSLPTWTADPTDGTYLVRQDTGGSSTFGRVTFSTIANYVKSKIANATQSVAGYMSAADKKKLDGIATGAEVNQNAFAAVKVGSTTIYADGKSDTLTLTAGSNVTLTPYASDDTVTISATNTTYSDATTSTHGLMSTSDKSKLNGISSSAKNVHYVKAVTLTAAAGSIAEYSWTLTDLGVSSADNAGEKLFINAIAESRYRHYSYCYISSNKFYVVLANDSTDSVRAKIVVFRID